MKYAKSGLFSWDSFILWFLPDPSPWIWNHVEVLTGSARSAPISFMSTQAIPEVYDSLIPSLVVADAAKAIEFYKDVFGAQEMMRMNYPNQPKIAHAELKIRDHVLMLGDECPEMGVSAPKPGGPMPPRSTMIYVNDVDATYQKALSKGATPAMPPMDMFWGDRYGKFIDPFGHLWGVATHKKEVSKEECDEAMKNWGKNKPGEK